MKFSFVLGKVYLDQVSRSVNLSVETYVSVTILSLLLVVANLTDAPRTGLTNYEYTPTHNYIHTC